MKFQFLSILVITTVFFSIHVNAENIGQQKIVCKSVDACEKLAHSLQTQINKLEKNDDPDFDKLDELQIQILIVLDLLIVEQKKVTAGQDKVLVKLKKVTAEQRKIQAEQRKIIADMLQAQDKKIKELIDMVSE